jgi:hypothetical protein
MNPDGNMARQIRAMAETLSEWAYEYAAHGKAIESEELTTIAEMVGHLHRLPDPDEETSS